jgi:5'-3' exonuclease
LRGDASDGLPGVAGIGEKTAATLLQRYGSLLDMLQAAIDQRVEFPPGPRAKLLSSLGYLAVAPHVVNVVRDLDLPTVQTDISLVPMNPERLDHLAQRWGLTSSLNRLIEAATQSSNAE